MHAKSRDTKTRMVFLYLLAFGLLLALYAFYLAPFWAYMGFEMNPSGMKILGAAGVIVIFVLLTPTEANVRNFFLNLILTVFLLPSMTLYSYADKPTSSALIIWIGLGIVYLASTIPVPRIILLDIRAQNLMWALAIATTCLLASYYALSGLRNFNLDISKVYEFRDEASAALPSFFGYISSSFSKIIIPFGLTASIMYKRYAFSIFFLLSSVLIFGFTSNKSVIFSPILVLLTYIFLYKYTYYKYILIVFLSILFTGLVSSFIISYYGEDSIIFWYNSLLIRRSLMLPALIDSHYFDYFSNNPYYYWSDSKISLGLVQNPYGLPPPNLIGKLFFGSSATSANTGFIGSGFAQAGLIGVLLYSVGAGLVLAILQSYGRYLGLPFVAAVMVDMVFVMITSTDFLTLLLTHGLLLAFVLLSLTHPPMPEERLRLSRQKTFPMPIPSEGS